VSGVGVRCPWVPAFTVSGREVVEGGAGVGSRMAGMVGVGVVARGVQGQFFGCPGGAWRSRLAQVCWVSGGVGLDLAVVVGGG
jgi:hypothetical protein